MGMLLLMGLYLALNPAGSINCKATPDTFSFRSLVEEDDPAISAVVCSRMDDADIIDEDFGDDSPMILDTSHQRVPENGEDIEATAEISLFPEYEQVQIQIYNN